jgi:hypothetical protein
MTNKKIGKFDLQSLIVCAVMVVSLIVAIVGMVIGWTQSTGSVLGSSTSATQTLSDWLGNSNANIGANAAFAIITVIMLGLTAGAFVASKFVKKPVMRFVVLGAAVVTLVAAIVTIITAYTFVGSLASINLGGFASGNFSVFAGPWLVAIFGIVGGAAATFAVLKK